MNSNVKFPVKHFLRHAPNFSIHAALNRGVLYWAE